MKATYFVTVVYLDHIGDDSEEWSPGLFGPFASEKEAQVFRQRVEKVLGKLSVVACDVVYAKIPNQYGIDEEVESVEASIDQNGGEA